MEEQEFKGFDLSLKTPSYLPLVPHSRGETTKVRDTFGQKYSLLKNEIKPKNVENAQTWWSEKKQNEWIQ